MCNKDMQVSCILELIVLPRMFPCVLHVMLILPPPPPPPRMEKAHCLIIGVILSPQELWVEWLRVKANELTTSSANTAAETHDHRQQVLDDLCTQAMATCPSYAVVFEVKSPNGVVQIQ